MHIRNKHYASPVIFLFFPSDMVVAWALWGLWAWVLHFTHAFCPPGCTCDDALPSARCVGVGINLVPILFNPSLRRLNLAHNSIRSLEEAFDFLEKLQELDASHNLLTSLGTSNFKAQRNLLELRLAHNNLTSLLPGAFRGLEALKSLDLSHNGMSELPDQVLDDLPGLTVLHLSHNRLHVLTDLTFRGPNHLLVLDLCDNYFRHVPTQALTVLVSLETLSLCRNRLTRIGPRAFPTDALTSLSLDTNNIDTIDKVGFANLNSLQKLTLDYNTLKEVPSHALQPLHTLQYLSISRNKIRIIDTASFDGLENLLTLEVSRSPNLEEVEPGALDGCSRLQSLTLSHNPRLKALPPGLFSHLTDLSNLDLRANGLESLPEEEVPWRSLRRLEVRDNPLVCNCSLRWLAVLLREVNTTLTSRDLQCASPDKLRGLYLSRSVGLHFIYYSVLSYRQLTFYIIVYK